MSAYRRLRVKTTYFVFFNETDFIALLDRCNHFACVKTSYKSKNESVKNALS